MGNLESSPPLPKVENDLQKTKTTEDSTDNDFRLDISSFPQMTCFELTTGNGDFKPDFSWKINDVSQLLQGKKTARVKSPPFTWSNYQVQAVAKMDVKGNGQVILSMRLEEISLVIIEPLPAVYYVLKDVASGDRKHRSGAINYTLPVKFNYSLPFQVSLTHRDWLTHSSYNVDDSVTIEVYVEAPSIAQQVHSTNGTLNWAIDDYSRRKDMALEELVLYAESPYFYAGSRYRVRVRMWLNGYKAYEGKGLTAEVCFLPGEFDTDLPLTFDHQTTVTLFNRKQPRNNVVKTIAADIRRSKSYFMDLCEHGDIGNLMDNDAVFYKVAIVPASSNQEIVN